MTDFLKKYYDYEKIIGVYFFIDSCVYGDPNCILFNIFRDKLSPDIIILFFAFLAYKYLNMVTIYKSKVEPTIEKRPKEKQSVDDKILKRGFTNPEKKEIKGETRLKKAMTEVEKNRKENVNLSDFGDGNKRSLLNLSIEEMEIVNSYEKYVIDPWQKRLLLFIFYCFFFIHIFAF